MSVMKLSMRGFAEVISAAPDRKVAVLNRFQSSSTGDGIGRSNYYVRALSLIKSHHRGESDHVKSSLEKLLGEGQAETNKLRKAKLLSNHRSVCDYLSNFGKRELTIISSKRLYYIHGDIIVSAQPDLVAMEQGDIVLIKLNLSKKDFKGGVGSTLLHVLYEAARAQGLQVKPDKVECLQASSGTKLIGPTSGFPSKQILNSQCLAIANLGKL